jgi:adenylylsulfate kinase-like enzyme
MQPIVVWLTGEPAAGKSTTAHALIDLLREEYEGQDTSWSLIEGEDVRKVCSSWDFSPKGRDEHVKRVADLAGRLSFFCDIVICALVSPAAESRQTARWIVDRYNTRFLEVHCTCNPQVLANRQDARPGTFDYEKVPYEAPRKPNLVLDTGKLDAATCAQRIFELF